MSKKKNIQFKKGSGNVYEDLRLEDADELYKRLQNIADRENSLAEFTRNFMTGYAVYYNT